MSRRAKASVSVIIGMLAVSAAVVGARAGGRKSYPTPTKLDSHQSPFHQLKKVPGPVSDALAYRHLLKVLAEHSHASRTESIVVDSIISQMKLGSEDRPLVHAAVSGLREGLEDVQKRRGEYRDDSPETRFALSELRDSEQQLLDHAKATLSTTLTADGLAKLDSYVQSHVKPRITIYGE